MHDDDRDDEDYVPHFFPGDPIVRITRWDIALAVAILLFSVVYCSLQ